MTNYCKHRELQLTVPPRRLASWERASELKRAASSHRGKWSTPISLQRMAAAVVNFKHLLEELGVFHRNLGKDSLSRKKDGEYIKRKISKLDKLKLDLNSYKAEFNQGSFEPKVVLEAKDLVSSISKYIDSIDKILRDRLELVILEEQSASKMGEKFDLKTAAGLLPIMDNKEGTTKQLIDSIELYDELLDAEGKRHLVNYVLKTRLSQSAKVRLSKTYNSNTDLIADLRSHFITKKSSASLSTQLNNIKQGNRSIDEFGASIEELMVNLTLSQADGNDNAVIILSSVNEKLAINAFANGLHSSELRTIVKARNYEKLNDAIRGAKDEDLSKKSSVSQTQMTYIRGRNFSQNRFNRGSRSRISTFNGRASYGNFSNNFHNNSQYRSNANFSNFSNRSGSGRYTRRNAGRFRGNYRGNYSNQNNNHRLTYIGNQDNNNQNSSVGSQIPNTNSSQSTSQQFFRA